MICAINTEKYNLVDPVGFLPIAANSDLCRDIGGLSTREIRILKPTGEYAFGTFTYTVGDDRKEVMHQGGMRSVEASERIKFKLPKRPVNYLLIFKNWYVTKKLLNSW